MRRKSRVGRWNGRRGTCSGKGGEGKKKTPRGMDGRGCKPGEGGGGWNGMREGEKGGKGAREGNILSITNGSNDVIVMDISK